MPVPKPNEGEKQQDYISRCIKFEMDEGKITDNKQAAAICYSTWREDKNAGKSLALSALITRAERQKDGRVRWRARANSGDYDQQDERFDESFFDELVHNFGVVQETLTRSEVPSLPVPILDLAHYSLFIPRAQRAQARAGYPNRLWRDGKALMAEGYFDSTPLGQLAAQAALERQTDDRRVSICVWPDWGNVEESATGRVFKGGRGVAYLDHLAMTAHPVDADTEIEVLEVKSMGTIADDAAQVLGDSDEAQKEVAILEAARVKSDVVALPEGVVIKTENPKPKIPELTAKKEAAIAKAAEDVSGEGAQDEAAKAQQVRSGQYGIAILPQGNITKPGEWATLEDSQFGDPVNYRYPMGDDAHIANARARFAQETETYRGKEVVGGRIEAAAKAAGIGTAAEGKPEEKSQAVPPPDPTEAIAKALHDLLPQIAAAIDERLEAVASLPAQLAALKSEVAALKAPIAEKVKAALDAGPSSDWLTLMVKNSVQRPSTGTVKGEGKPAETSGGEFAAMFGNPTKP